MPPRSGGSKSKPGKPKSKSRSAAARKTKAPSKSGSGKKPAAGRKKTRAGKKSLSAWPRFKANLVYMSAGLLLGLAGTLVLFYFTGVFDAPDRSGSAKVRPALKQTPTGKKKPPPKVITYEENNRLDRKIKLIDQVIFRALTSVSVPEKNINITKLTSRQDDGLEWNHATIEVRTTPDFSNETFSLALIKGLKGLRFYPHPKMESKKSENATSMIIYFNGLETHELKLMQESAEASTQIKPEREKRPKVAIIIDDLGQYTEQASCFLKFKGPLAFSILPYLGSSKKVAQLAHEAGQVVMLHLPMQPAHYPEVDPGQGALLVDMDREEIIKRIRQAVSGIPHLIGANNHMGSRFTEDAERMGWVLEELNSLGLYFVDSRTSVKTQAYKTARSIGLKTAERAVFLDNIQEPEAITIQLKRLVALARQRGKAIAIGHPYAVTCQVLIERNEYLNSRVEIVKVTDLLD